MPRKRNNSGRNRNKKELSIHVLRLLAGTDVAEASNDARGIAAAIRIMRELITERLDKDGGKGEGLLQPGLIDAQSLVDALGTGEWHPIYDYIDGLRGVVPIQNRQRETAAARWPLLVLCAAVRVLVMTGAASSEISAVRAVIAGLPSGHDFTVASLRSAYRRILHEGAAPEDCAEIQRLAEEIASRGLSREHVIELMCGFVGDLLGLRKAPPAPYAG